MVYVRVRWASVAQTARNRTATYGRASCPLLLTEHRTASQPASQSISQSVSQSARASPSPPPPELGMIPNGAGETAHRVEIRYQPDLEGTHAVH